MRIPKRTAYYLIRDDPDAFKTVRVGKHLRVSRADYEAYVASQRGASNSGSHAGKSQR
jgi:hypothetical protein